MLMAQHNMCEIIIICGQAGGRAQESMILAASGTQYLEMGFRFVRIPRAAGIIFLSFQIHFLRASRALIQFARVNVDLATSEHVEIESQTHGKDKAARGFLFSEISYEARLTDPAYEQHLLKLC